MIFSSAPNDFLNLKYSDELYHHGVKGQKWGIRKYQNPDGSLTPEGQKRYGHMQNYEGKSSITKKIMKDWWDLDDNNFKGKYHVDKETYSKRVAKYGDPYRNKSAAAKFATSGAGRIVAKSGAKSINTLKRVGDILKHPNKYY